MSLNPDQRSAVHLSRNVFRGMYAFLWGLVAVGAIAIALAGCGGDDGSATEATTSAEATGSTASSDEGILVAALGDSITAGSPLYDPDPATQAQIGAALDEQSQFELWASREDGSLQFRNCGVFGERTDEIAMRLDECADGADALIVQGGINDIAQGRAVEDAAADLRGMVRAGERLGLPVTLVDVLPWNNGHPAADEPIEQLNAEIERIGEREGVPVVPFHDALESSAEPGTMPPDLTIDGDHPSVAGYKILGGELADNLARP